MSTPRFRVSAPRLRALTSLSLGPVIASRLEPPSISRWADEPGASWGKRLSQENRFTAEPFPGGTFSRGAEPITRQAAKV